MNLSLQYLIKEPKNKSNKSPLLLLLHGYGSNEADLFSFATELPDDYYVVAARAPYNLQYGSYAWYAINFDANENKFSDHEQAKSSCDLVTKFIDELIKNYPIDKDSVSLLGFSQGAILSYAIALSNPEKIKKVIALSGYLNLDIVAENYKINDFSNLKIFAAHGTMDQVIPIAWARKAQPVLNELKITNVYKEYPIAHGVGPQTFYDFKMWLKLE